MEENVWQRREAGIASGGGIDLGGLPESNSGRYAPLLNDDGSSSVVDDERCSGDPVDDEGGGGGLRRHPEESDYDYEHHHHHHNQPTTTPTPVNFVALSSRSEFNPHGTGTVSSVFLLVNAALGAGILNFPKAFAEAGGIAEGVSVQAALLVFVVGALLALARAADHRPTSANNQVAVSRDDPSPPPFAAAANDAASSTLQDAVGAAAGRAGQMVCSALVALYCFGTTVTFLIIVGDQTDLVLGQLLGPEEFCRGHWYLSRQFTIPAAAVLLILPLCFSKRIDFLRLPSALGVFAVLYLVGLIVAEYYYGGDRSETVEVRTVRQGGGSDDGPPPKSWTDLFLVVPDICFAYQCHVSAIPIYSCMRRRTLRNFSVVVAVAIAVCAACYTLSACYGFLTFGSSVSEDVLLSYDASRPEVLAGIVAVALKSILTYPVLLFCGREAVKSVIADVRHYCSRRSGASSRRPLVNEDCPEARRPPWYARWAAVEGELLVRVSVALLWFTASVAMAVLLADIGEVIRLLGSLAAIFIFVFPGVCLLQMTIRADPSLTLGKNKVRLACSVLMLVTGAFVFGVVLTQSIKAMIAKNAGTSAAAVSAKRARIESFCH